MTDLEKVMKGLECCVLHDPDDKARCIDCPYRYPIESNCVNRMKHEALALLKKQIPKKAGKVKLPCRCGRVRSRTSDGYGEYYGKVVITCPGCGEIVTGDTEEEAIENWNRRNRKNED